MEAADHSLMHHELCGCLQFGLGTPEVHAGQIARAVEVPLFITGHLLVHVVASRVALQLLHYQVVRRSHLVVLVILNISDGLL
jgi:hypothetical protein